MLISIALLLQDYAFLEETPYGLPLIQGIEHQVDFMPNVAILNQLTYISNLEKTKELQSQVCELIEKDYVREIMSPCAVLVLVVLKNDRIWRMCVDC